jgi:DNA-binding response OmpR family regulator
VVKPFGFCELVARIRAVTRRRHPESPEPRAEQVGALQPDRRARRVFVDGTEVALTPKEFDLLALPMEEPGVVVTRRRILELVWGHELVRALAQPRRARRVAAPQARRPEVGGDRPRSGVPARTAVMIAGRAPGGGRS